MRPSPADIPALASHYIMRTSLPSWAASQNKLAELNPGAHLLPGDSTEAARGRAELQDTRECTKKLGGAGPQAPTAHCHLELKVLRSSTERPPLRVYGGVCFPVSQDHFHTCLSEFLTNIQKEQGQRGS